jgi:PEP-CTERM motif
MADGEFISTYARDYPDREDIAESFLPYLALRYRADRISQSLSDTISQTIPNRINYFSDQSFDMYPFVIGLPGDYNQNGIVDAADYVVWSKNVGASTALPNDLIGGTIGATQYNQWRANYGKTAPGAGSGSDGSVNAAVPEPATLVLLMFAAAGCCLLRRRAA